MRTTFERVDLGESVTLYLGDCLEVLPTLEAGSVDAVVTDPPYGIYFRDNGWDKEIPNWLDKARAISPLVVFTTAPATLWDYPRPDWVLCWYRDGSTSRTLQGGFNWWSPIMVYGRKRIWVDGIRLPSVKHIYESGFGHPSPKPVALMQWLVENYTPAGGIVIDPFMGSGTTGVACVQTGRRFIGVEIDPTYFEIAVKRISDALKQPRLFDAPQAAQPQQERMLP